MDDGRLKTSMDSMAKRRAGRQNLESQKVPTLPSAGGRDEVTRLEKRLMCAQRKETQAGTRFRWGVAHARLTYQDLQQAPSKL